MEGLNFPASSFRMERLVLRPRLCTERWSGGLPIQGNSISQTVRFPRRTFWAVGGTDSIRCWRPSMGEGSALPRWVWGVPRVLLNWPSNIPVNGNNLADRLAHSRSIPLNWQTWPQRLSWQGYCFINPVGYVSSTDLSPKNRLWQRCSALRCIIAWPIRPFNFMADMALLRNIALAAITRI